MKKIWFKVVSYVMIPLILNACNGNGKPGENPVNRIKAAGLIFTEEQVRSEMTNLESPMAQETDHVKKAVIELERNGLELKRRTDLTLEQRSNARNLYNFSQEDLTSLRSGLALDVRRWGGEQTSSRTSTASENFEKSARDFNSYHYKIVNEERGILTLVAIGADWLVKLLELSDDFTDARYEAMARIIEKELVMKNWDQL